MLFPRDDPLLGFGSGGPGVEFSQGSVQPPDPSLPPDLYPLTTPPGRQVLPAESLQRFVEPLAGSLAPPEHLE